MRRYVMPGVAFFLFAAGWGSWLHGQVAPPPSKPGPPATVSSSPESEIVPPPPGYKFPNGQTYVFGVEWHLFNAGTAKVKMESAGSQQRVTALADSTGVVNALYKVHDRFEALFDRRTFCSLQVVKHTEEGSRKRDTQIRFDYARHKSVLDEKNRVVRQEGIGPSLKVVGE